MAKKVNITDKLDFSGNPSLIIKDQEIEVDASAETVLRVMGKMSEGSEGSPKFVMDMYELIFPEKSRNAIAAFNLQFNDFTKVVEAGISLIVDSDEEEGE